MTRDMDPAAGGGWDQLYLRQVRYVDYREAQDQERFLVTVDFRLHRAA